MKKRFLSLALGSLLISTLSAEDNGFFIGVGYQIGEASQMVKNTGALKNLNDKYEQLNSSLAQVAALRQSIQNANNYELVKQSISNLISFANNNSQNKDLSPIYSSAQAVLTSVLAFWSLYAGNNLTFNTGDSKTNDHKGNPPTYSCHEQKSKDCMPIETYKKMEALAKSLQETQGTLCALSGCSSDQSNKGAENAQKQNATLSGAIQKAQELMDLIHTTNTNMNWDKININGLKKPVAAYGGGKVGGKHEDHVIYQGNIASNNPVTSYAIFQNIYKMLPYLQEALKLAQDTTAQSNHLQAQATGSPENPNFSKDIYTFAQNQQTILSNASKIFDLFNSIPKDEFEYLQKAYLKQPFLGSTPDVNKTPFKGNVNLNAEIDSVQKNVNYWGSQVDKAVKVAKDVYNLKSNQDEIINAYNTANNLSQEISQLPHNKLNTKDIILPPEKPNAPKAAKYEYRINQAQQSQLSLALESMSRNPFKNIGMINAQNNSGAMNGIGVQVGYKQFFGKNRIFGARYYGFFDYNHGYIKSSFFNSDSDVWTYGVGSDFLVNFLNDKELKNSNFSMGVFGGIALAGTTWLNSQFVNLTTFNNVYSAKVHNSNFQFLINLGLRMNLAAAKKKDNKHSAQNGIELGVKIPTINTNYYSFAGTQLQYRRLYSIYLNYVFAY
ncbi:outer membrane protein [Helicobacter pylori]|nr:outer membrane protein [Helicobacter pylori]